MANSLWPLNCGLSGSSVHGIFQARILKWVAISPSRSSPPRDQTCISYVSCSSRQILHPLSYLKSHAKIKASGPITSWQINRKKVETVTDFILSGSKITADCDCSRAIKRCLLLGRKAMTNLDSILKSRDVTLPTKVCIVKAIVFPVVMYGCESWTIKKAERQRIDAFKLWCWRRLLRVPWTAKRSKPVNPKRN